MTSVFSNPVFSIITPTFRRPEMLKRNIRSVLSQTYGNYEHIIVDDGNDPETDMIVRSFGDERVRLLKHNLPKGAAASYNTGMKAAKGEFISFLDDDDEYMQEYFEKIIAQFSTSSEIGFIWTGIERVNDREDGSEYIIRKVVWPAIFTDFETGMASATSIGNGYGVCIRKKCLNEIGYYDEELLVGEDTDFLFRLAANYKFATIPEILVRIHSHERDQLTGKQNFSKRIEGKETILKRYKVVLKQYPKVFITHNYGYATLCYESGLKSKGRDALLSVIGKDPFRLIWYLDLLSFETTSYAFGSTRLGLKIKSLINKVNYN
ncbi:MAG: glycosyltransferase family 2 protein [Methanococcaceae archaeon]